MGLGRLMADISVDTFADTLCFPSFSSRQTIFFRFITTNSRSICSKSRNSRLFTIIYEYS